VLQTFRGMAFGVVLLLWACPPPPPDTLVVVPAADNTPVTIAMDVFDPDPLTIPQTAPVTLVAVSDVVTVIARATDEDGGIKSVKMWATYTYSKPGVVAGPGLVSAPVNESISTAVVGQSTLKSRNVAFNFDLKKELAGWTRVKVDVWVEADNFFGNHVQTPAVSLVYPRAADDTDYMAFCRRGRVPIPPDWSVSTTEWQFQGNLGTGTNLLQPGINAQVWTYNDPFRRGACIALPRGGGGQRGGLAGIICQSAATGKACFWDSRKRDNNDPMKQTPVMDWASQTLKISELKDASNLTEPGSGRCTDCHRGENVFLVAPDDPTWTKVMRGPLVTTPGSKFTVRVEASPDVAGGHPRYVPVTYPTNRPDWVNTFSEGGCGGSCHERADDFQARGIPVTPPMPAACATGGDPANCYR